MKILYFCLHTGCVALVLASATPALGKSDAPPGAAPDYIVSNSTSASGWATVTVTPLKVECERILRSVSMDIYVQAGDDSHRHDSAKITCDERRGHFSVRVDMNGGAGGEGRIRDAVGRYLSTVYVPVSNVQTAHRPEDGHRDHQHVIHVIHIFHDLE